ncbi:MAG: hypothetical protein QNJ98_14835 [Planctomycetota bacterium]|nr:hypothetical protein [Planctomycetota bacterium]
MTRVVGIGVLLTLVVVLAVLVAVLVTLDPLGGNGAPPATSNEDMTVDAPPSLVAPERAMEVDPTARAVGPDVDLATVDRARDLHGVVVLRDGSPVAGTKVVLLDLPWRGLMINDMRRVDASALASTATGPRGTFALRLAVGARGLLVVDGGDRGRRQLYLASAGERVRIVLDGGVSLRVTVTAPDGTPAAEVPVNVGGAGAGNGPTAPALLHTDEDGVLQVDSLDPGGAVYVWAVPFREGVGHSRILRITLPTSGTHEHAIELPRARTLRGVVTDAATGEPLASARVGMGYQMDPSVSVDEAGRYVLFGFTGDGVRDVTASAPGYVRGRVMPDTESEELDFALVKGAVVTGRIVTVAGTPLEGARVVIVGSAHQGGSQRLSLGNAATDASGRFEVDGLARDLPLSIQVRATGFGRRIVDIDAVHEARLEVDDIVLQPPLTIAGTILQGGAPAARMPVRIFGANADRAERRESKEAPHAYYGTREDVVTDDLGRFVVNDMSAGSYEVIVKPRAPLATRDVELDGTQARTEVTIDIGATRTLKVTVLDPDGEPLTHGMVSVRKEVAAVNGRLDTQGQTEVVFPTDFEWIVVVPFGEAARAELVHDVRHPIPEGEDTLVIRMQRASVVRGVVLKPDGTPIPQAFVVATVDGRRGTYAIADAKGRFTLKTNAPRVDVRFSGKVHRGGREQHVPFFGAVEDVSNGTDDVRIQTTALAGTETLTVRVVGPDGPLEGLSVYIQPGKFRYETTNADGVVRFTGLSRVPRTVKAFGKGADGVLWGQEAITATPGDGEATIRMRVPKLVTGTVVDADDQPVQGAMIMVLRDDGTNRIVTGGQTPEDGTFTVSIPDDTKLLFTATARIGKVMYEAKLRIDAMPTAPIVLKLRPKGKPR